MRAGVKCNVVNSEYGTNIQPKILDKARLGNKTTLLLGGNHIG
jgi:hypothetical protein